MTSTIGQRIKKFRQEADLTLQALADNAGISKGYLWQLEQGETSNPSIDTLSKIAKALDRTIAELMYGQPLITPKKEQKVHDLPESLKEFIKSQEEQKQPLTNDDIRMLANIHYRGKRPSRPEDWDMLYNFIRMVSRGK